MPTLQSPVEEKINEYETYLNGFLPHVVVEQKTGVPEQKKIKKNLPSLFYFNSSSIGLTIKWQSLN